eukprot:749322-Hanusia_phi.AAC.3
MPLCHPCPILPALLPHVLLLDPPPVSLLHLIVEAAWSTLLVRCSTYGERTRTLAVRLGGGGEEEEEGP